MKKTLLYLFIMLFISISSFSQEEKKPAEPPMSNKEARRMKKLLGQAIYPLIKSQPMAGVIPVTGIDAWPDSTQPYKLLFVWTFGTRDSAKVKKVNFALTEIGRVVNLHLAAGIPLANMEVVVAVHGLSVFSLQNDETYQKMFHTNNPNTVLIKELQDAGVKFIACGQAMSFLEVEKKTLLPGIKMALTAQTILSSYQMKGFVLYDENTED